MRVVAAAWAGVLAGFVPGIALDLPVPLGIAIGVAVAAADPRAARVALAARRRSTIEVRDGELRLAQGARTRTRAARGRPRA